jgi:hypothetical protein
MKPAPCGCEGGEIGEACVELTASLMELSGAVALTEYALSCRPTVLLPPRRYRRPHAGLGADRRLPVIVLRPPATQPVQALDQLLAAGAGDVGKRRD